MPSKKFFLCMYKMVDISIETLDKAEVPVINIHVYMKMIMQVKHF